MPRDPLPPDPDSLDKWEKLPQNKPSKEALPPAAAGGRLALGLLLAMALLIILVLILQQGPA